MAIRWQYILCSLFILLCWAGCGRNHIRQAEDLRQNRLYEESLEHYLEALKSDPDRIDVRIDIDRLLKEASAYYFQLGQEQEKMNKGEMAVLLYKKSLEFDPANNHAQQALRTLVGLGPTLKDFEAVKKEMEINVGLPAAWTNSPLPLTTCGMWAYRWRLPRRSITTAK